MGDTVSSVTGVVGVKGAMYGCKPGCSSTGVGYLSSSRMTYSGAAFDIDNLGLDNLLLS